MCSWKQKGVNLKGAQSTKPGAIKGNTGSWAAVGDGGVAEPGTCLESWNWGTHK